MGYIKVILGAYWDKGKENGNYFSIIGYIKGLCWVLSSGSGVCRVHLHLLVLQRELRSGASE